jgi:biotin transport system ATP-binding protein
LNGLLRPSAGTVHVDGIDIKSDPAHARQIIGMVFQDADTQIVGETVFDDVAFGPENLGLKRSEIQERVSAALSAVGLTHLADQRPHLLSGGEKRRCAIAGVLAMQARIIVLDEPFSNLDLLGVRQVLSQITALRQTGHTLLLTTHDLDWVIGMADRLVVMDRGKIVRDGSPLETARGIARFGVREPTRTDVNRRNISWPN